jgi:radical SAM protein with 4Fe4S-binding SPASM domain
MNKYGDQYFPKGTQSPSTILRNSKMLLEWFAENRYAPALEIFAGDSVTDPVCRKIAHQVYDMALDGKRAATSLMIPTNFSWIRFDKYVRDVEDIKEKSEYTGIPYSLSASVDGKYMDECNRPLKSCNKAYDEEFYNKVFEFSAKHRCGFHPMVYSNNIERWIDNFLWFQDNFEKYGIGWKNLYLLEVRNVEWTEQQTIDYSKFIKFLIHWSYDKCDRDSTKFHDFIKNGRGFNILSSWSATIGRGVGCSIQSNICTRVGDLGIVPCHRLAYKYFDSGRFVVENNKITGVEADNLELWLMIQAYSSKVAGYCEKCRIKSVCHAGCLGAQYEITGDMFAPIPTVCRLFHTKVYTIIETLKEIGELELFLTRLNTVQEMALLEIMETMED